jgi:hypothetical protein
VTVSDDVSRARHIGLERRAETVVHGRPRPSADRRVALEEELALALAAGDRERVSELRAAITAMAEGLGA